MPSLILDCSAALAWLMPDEDEPAALAIGRLVQSSGAVVPQLWHLEFANALSSAVKNKKRSIELSDMRAILALAAQLHIEEDPHTSSCAWGATTDLALQYELSLYDAAYLELAIRRTLPLATFDKKLTAAAATLGLLHPAIATSGLSA
jgi:predicted nucleic acid-binding protein